MKNKKIIKGLIAIFLLTGFFASRNSALYTTTSASSSRMLTEGLVELNDSSDAYFGVDKVYGTVHKDISLYYNHTYKYSLSTRSFNITNTSQKPMTIKIYVPYVYTYGLNNTDNDTYDYIGYPYSWNNDLQRFYILGDTTFSFVDNVTNASVAYPTRNSLEFSEYLTNPNYYYIVGDGNSVDFDSNPAVVKELPTISSTDTVMEITLNETIPPGETKSFTYVVKTYGSYRYTGVSGTQYIHLLNYSVEGAPVIIEYVDTQGNPVAPSDILNDDSGFDAETPYTTSPKEIPGYTLVNSPTNASGVYSDVEQVVTYVYDVLPNTYTVTFNTLGGNYIEPQTIVEGGSVTEPPAPTREGYTFGGWTLMNSNQLYDFSTPVTGNIELVAIWEEIIDPIKPIDPTDPIDNKETPVITKITKSNSVPITADSTNITSNMLTLFISFIMFSLLRKHYKNTLHK